MLSIPLVIKRLLGHLLTLTVAGLSPLLADTSATVTEAVNDVSHGTSQSAITEPAKSGTHLQDGEYLKTGVKSRAELQLANQTVTRLGANTIFNYTSSSNEVDLEAGTVLFSKPKGGKEMTIKTEAVTAAIVGTSGFAHLEKKAFIFGLIEGHAVLTSGGTQYKIGPGEILQLAGTGKPQLFFFNIPLFLKTSPLITKFHSTLPNQVYIDSEVARYNDFAARGFIGPATVPFFISGIDGSVPILPIPARDSAGNALNTFNNPPPPPPPHSMPASNPFGAFGH
jgi:hypothetical protein